MNRYVKLFFCTILFYFISNSLIAKNIWIIDKEISEINFELPILLVNNIKGNFKKFDGSVIIDSINKDKNRIFFSIEVNSMELNNLDYKEFLLSEGFFDAFNFPIVILDTKRFSVPESSNNLEINAELQIKNIVQNIPVTVEINHLANDLVQVKANLEFSRNSYNLGKEKRLSTLILRDKIYINANLFLNRE